VTAHEHATSVLPNRLVDPSEQARQAALYSVATVVAEHLRDEDRDPKLRGDETSPLLVHVDGPGKSTFLETLAGRLDHGSGSTAKAGWSAVRFDAWQHQRVAPPWWWLINTLDRDLRKRFTQHSRWLWFSKRIADIVGFRIRRFLADAMWVLPGILVLGVAVWLSDMSTLARVIGTLAGVVGGLAALFAFGASVINAVRRHLLSQSPGGAKAVLSTSDPMGDLLQRYGFLVNTAGTPIVILIDNLDRCRADYVVELLEGIQTLLRVPPERERRKPLVAFVVAGDEAWLCNSYLQVYDKFAASSHEPGRPFGQGFLDKIFDVSLRLPTVPSAATVTRPVRDRSAFESCGTELAVRETLAKLEGDQAPKFDLRIEAVGRLGELEVNSKLRQCGDTGDVLRALRVAADLGPIVDKRLETGYCVQRTSQLLGGHAIDHDKHAIARLGLWTMLSIRWPLLAAYLIQHPDEVEAIRDARPPELVPDDLAPAFHDSAAVRLARGSQGVALSPDDIQRYTTPIAPAQLAAPATDGSAAALQRGMAGSRIP
jgi:hypothetical protein